MRTEHDTMGAVQVPDDAYYGAQTQRAVENFPISGKTMPPELIHALGLVKWACAKANAELGLLQSGRSPLTDEQIDALLQACLEVAEGKFDDQFPVDVYQSGSGTSTNMNANEVIARRANEIVRDHNSPPSEGWHFAQQNDGVVLNAGRATKKYRNLPYNPELKERSRELRKAGNLSEVLFWNQVKKKQFKNLDFDRQKIIGNYIVDFYCANCNVVIEIDGESHDYKQESDAVRDEYLKTLGLVVIRIPDIDIKKDIDAVMAMLRNHPALSGTPSKEGNDHPAATRHPSKGGEYPIHPNDHVNMGQSTNDIFPTAIHVAMAQLIDSLNLALSRANKELVRKSSLWRDILKIGRTHLADATPMTLGQEFSGFSEQMEWTEQQSIHAYFVIRELTIGGTAVGTGINTHHKFSRKAIKYLNEYLESKLRNVPFSPFNDGSHDYRFDEVHNHFSGNAQRDNLVYCHARIKSIAVTLFNIANNIRWLGSGPRAGFYEIKIPDLQPGSSIMPGKVNPVLCEALMQACARVIGNDQTMTFCGASGGQFQLNIMMPVMADTAIESVKILSGALEVFTEKCLAGLEANEEKCREGVEKSLSMATALNPHIGYEKAAEVAKEAFKTGKTVREVCLEWEVLPPEQLDEVLDPWKMIKPIERSCSQ